MKHKIVESYIYEGLGFPVHLTNAPMIEVRGEFILDIDYNKLQKAVLLYLCHKKEPLTGNEVKFVRKYLSLTTTDFGRLFGYSHSAILKWESQEDHIAKMDPAIEIYLRLYIFDLFKKGASDFKELYKEIRLSHLAEYSKNIRSYTYQPPSINAKKDLAFAK